MVGAILIDMRDGWIADDHRCLSEGYMAECYENSGGGTNAAIESGE